MKIKGFVASGNNVDGKRDYWGKVSSALKLDLFEGTLNVKPYEVHDLLSKTPDFILFQYFACYFGKINGIDCIIGIRRHGYKEAKNMLFIMAEVKLRDVLNLKDGDDVIVTYKEE